MADWNPARQIIPMIQWYEDYFIKIYLMKNFNRQFTKEDI